MNKKVKTKISTLFMLVVLLAQTLTPVVTVFAEDTTMSTQTSSEVQSISESTSQVEVGQGETTTSNTIPVVPNTTPPSTTVSSEVSASTEVSSESPTSESQEDAATEESTEEDEEPAQSSTEVSETTTESTSKTEEVQKEISPLVAITDNILTDFSITDLSGNPSTPDKPLDPNSPEGVKISFKWALPEKHEVKAGDTFTFKLPDVFKFDSFDGKTEYQLLQGSISFGTYVISNTGEVTLTFNSQVEAEEVSGTVNVETWLDINKLADETTQIIKTPFEDEKKDVTLYLKPKNGSVINKQGTIDKGFKGTTATWKVDINTSLDKLVNPSVTDKIPEGMVFDFSSVKIYPLEVGLKGNIKSEGNPLLEGFYEVSQDDSGNPVIKLQNLTDEMQYQAYRIEYQTIVEEWESLEGLQTWENSAKLTNDGQTSAPVTGTVSSNYGKEITKNDPTYNSKSQTFDWKIQYNFGSKEISEAKIEDRWTPKGLMNLEIFNVYTVELDAEGKIVPKSEVLVDTSKYTRNDLADGSGFDLTFNQTVNQPYIIEYKTKMTESNNIITEDIKVDNTVTTNTGASDSSGGIAIQPGIVKKLRDVDVDKEIISWEIRINENNYDMDKLTLTDTFSDGLSLDETSLHITANSTQKKLEKGTDYTLNLTSNGFQIEFINNYASTSESFILSYDTKFKRNSDGTATYQNGANIKWTHEGKEYTSSSKPAPVTPCGYTGPNGVKNGAYNSKEKTITWEINTNYARLPITGKEYSIFDQLDESQEYLSKISVYTYTIDADGHITNKTELDENEYRIVKGTIQKDDKTHTTLEVIFEESAKAKRTLGISFETKFKGDFVSKDKIDNTAWVTSGEDKFELKAETTVIPNGNNFGNKTGEQVGNRINWAIVMNPNGSKITDYKLVDTVAEAKNTTSILIDDSFKVYEASIDDKGNVVKSKKEADKNLYTIDITSDSASGSQGFVISFAEIDAPFILEYQTFINLKGTGIINNTYVTSGNGIEVIGNPGEGSTSVQMSGSSGTAQGKLGSLNIIKLDEAGKTITGNRAKEASFELWNEAGTVRYRSALSLNEDGTLTFANIRAGKYRLVEKTPPIGYTVSEDYGGKGHVITVEITDENVPAIYKVTDPLYKVTLQKTDEAGKDLSGAEFALYEEGSTEAVTGYERIAVTGGQFELKIPIEHIDDKTIDLSKSYVVREVTGVLRYLLNEEASKPFKFELDSNNVQKPITATIINYQGSVKWKKTDNSEPPIGLEGAKFEAFKKNAEGKFIPTDKKGTSNKNGEVVIEGLEPGTYKLSEIKAPADYIKNPTLSSEFEIVSSHNGKPDTVELLDAALINYQIQAEMKKIKGIAPSENLEGAIFGVRKKGTDLYYNGVNPNGGKLEWVSKDQITTSGKFISKNDGTVTGPFLGTGTYEFVELEAPTGYIRNTKPVEFTIVTEETNSPLSILDAGSLSNYQGSIKLTKKDEKNNKIITPVTFELFKLLDGTEESLGTYTTNNGILEIKDLEPGNYSFKETASVDNTYVVNSKSLDFTIPEEAEDTKGIAPDVNFINYRGKATLNKTLKNGASTSVNREAKFRFRKKGTNEYYKKANETTGVAEFVSITGDVSDTDIQTDTIQKTDSTGQLTLTGLAPGEYEWIEIVAPSGYLIDNNPVSVTIGASSEGAAVVTNFENYQGSVQWKKTDNSTPPKGLPGAEFEVLVKNDSGSYSSTGKKTTSDKDGFIKFDGLAPGTYKIIEIKAPEGYLENPTSSKDFTILDRALAQPQIDLTSEPLINYQGSAQLTKFAADGTTTLTGAEFKVVKEKSSKVFEDVATGLGTDSDGIVTIDNLAPGKYAFVETKAPEGYILNPQPVEFEISDTPTASQPQTVTTGLTNYQGSAQLTKFQSDEESPISGAEFKVVKKNEQGAYEDVTKAPLTTDENGIVSISDLVPGEYAFVETKPAPGFVLDDSLQKFTVEATMSGDQSDDPSTITDKLTMTNAFTSFEFTKYVEEKQNLAEKVLPGVQFTIKNKENKHYNGGIGSATKWVTEFNNVEKSVKESLVSDEDGKVTVTGLAPGEYTVEEISTPTGTVIKKDSVLGITIADDGGVTFTGEKDIVNARELTKFSVTKTWDDESNAYGTRPGAIEFTLYRKTDSMTNPEKVPGYENVVINKPVETTDTWKHTFEDLVKHDSSGKEYQFSVEEEPVTGYTTRTDGGTNLTKDTQEIINTLDTIDIAGKKIWIDDENKYSTRPSNTQIVVELLLGEGDNAEPYLKNNQPVTTKLSLDGTYRFKGLPKTHPKTGKEVVYTVRDSVKGYVSSSNSGGTELTNTLQTINLSGTKTWENESTDTENVRPLEVTVQLLYSNDTPVKDKGGNEITTTFDTTNGGSYQFTNLPKYNLNGEIISYKVKEIGVPGYKSTPSNVIKKSNGDYTIDITNTLNTSMSIPVTKIWIGDESDLVTRPESIKLYLDRKDSKGKVTSEFKTLEYKATNKEENEWKGMTFTDLPTHDKYGQPFIYTIREEVPQGYTVSGTGTEITNENTSVQEITNTLLKSEEVGVTKKWADESDTSVRPNKILLYLYRSVDGKEEEKPYREQEVSVTKGLEQSIVFENLPKKDKNGKDYSYRVEEKQVTGYKEPIYSGITTNQKITNTLDSITVPVLKKWDDKTDISSRPDKVVIDLYRSTSKSTDNNPNNGQPFRTLELAASNKWTNEFTGLAKTDKDGEEFIYSIEERIVPGYKTNITGSQKDGFKVTNTLKLTQINVTKKWSDFSNQFGLRPDDIHLQLMKRVGEELVPVEKVTIKDNHELETNKVEMILSDKVKDKDQKSFVFSDLTKYDENGKEIQYVVTETPVTGYETTVENIKTEVDGEQSVIVTNALETIDIPVTKVWKDTFKGKENYYQSRPESITIRLKQNGKEIAQVPAVKVVDKEGNWSHVFKDLPKLDKDGEAYEYEVTEDTVDKYNTKIDVNESNKVTITNTRKTYAIGDYTWIDSNNDGMQGEDEEILEGVIVELFDEKGNPILDKDGKPMTTTTDKNGRYIFDELEDGKYTIKFTLTKEQSEKYEFTKQDAGENDKSDSDADELTGWTTTITLNDDSKELTKDYTDQKFKATEGIDPTWDAGVILREKIEVTGTKVWVGGPKVKPTIELQLYRNGEAFGNPVELKDGTTTYTWKDLYKTDTNKKPYVYTIQEVDTPSEYNKTEEGLKVTNTRKTYAIGDYTWIDTDKDGVQDKNEPVLPGVKVELFDENGKKIAETTTDKNGRYIFDELESGKYKVKFTLTDEQKKLYKFTKRHSGDAAKDSNADDEGWTIDIDLNENNAFLTLDYTDQTFKASEGIDPTWDAGVVLLDIPVKPTDPKDPKPELPQMGEAGNPFLLTSLGILLIGSVVGVVTTRRRRQG